MQAFGREMGHGLKWTAAGTGWVATMASESQPFSDFIEFVKPKAGRFIQHVVHALECCLSRAAGRHIRLIFSKGLLEDVESGIQFRKFVGNRVQLIRGESCLERGVRLACLLKLVQDWIIISCGEIGSGPAGVAQPVDFGPDNS